MAYLRRVVCAVIAVLSLAVSARAAQPWNGTPFSSDPKALLAAAEEVKPKSSDEGVVVLLDEAHYTFDEKGLMTHTQRLVFRVVDEAWAENWSSIDAAWSPWYEERPKVEGRVVAKDGSVHMLDPKSFSTADAEEEPNMFSDTRVVSGPLPAVAAGSVVEQLITYRSKPIAFDGGLSQRHTFGRSVATQQSRLVIDYPASLPFHLTNRTSPEIKPQRTENAGVVTLVFEARDLAAVKEIEWSLPSDVPGMPYVAFSTGKSWQDVATKYAAIIDKQIGSTESLAKLSASKPGDAKDPLAVATRLLANVVRNIRYAGVEFGEGSIVPRTPAETLEHKYGDCKDKATLLAAMLRQAGIPANVALLVSGDEQDVDPEAPGIGHFNHVIVVIPGTNPIWIDPTDEFARAGELPDSDQGRLALIASPATTSLTLTPEAPSTANRTIETREFKLPEDGKSTLIETTEYSGSEERSTRRYYANHDVKTVREQLEKYAKETFIADSLVRYETSDPNDLSKPFTLRLEIANAGRGITAGGEAAVGIFTGHLLNDMPWALRSGDDEEDTSKSEADKRKPRVHDFVFRHPYTYEMRYRVTPPAGYVLRAMPEKETLHLATATITKEYSAPSDTLVLVNYAVDSGPRRINAAQFEDMRKEIVRINNEKGYLLYFDQVGRKYLDAGEIGKAVAEFRRLALLHPNEALHHDDIARALLAGGMGSTARREAKRAVEVEPKSAKAHQQLGLVLANDLIGREFGAGCDVKGAVAEYRKAKELDPKDLNIRAEFAVLLERNAEGERYGDGAPLGEAIDEYVAMKKDKDLKVDKEAVDRELMVLYARTNRFADLQKLLDTTKDTQLKDIYTIVTAAALHGAPAAVTAANSIELSKRRTTLSTAASVLAILRRYPEAADLMNAAATGAPNAAQLRAQFELMKKMKRAEEVPPAPNDPKDVLRRFFVAAVKDSELAAVKRFMATDVLEAFDGDGVVSSQTSRLAQEGTAFKTKAAKEGNTAFFVDVALAAFEIQQDGNDDTGYRLLGRAVGGPSGTEMTMFVIRDKDGYRIAALNFAPSMLGYRALRLADAGKIDAARQWLDWARDYVNATPGDDPLSAAPFTAFWQRGAQASLDEIRLAAATLTPETNNTAKLALPILLAARDKTSEDKRWQIDHALANVYEASKNWTDLLTTADRLAAKYPDSQTAFRYGIRALSMLHRDAEVDQRAVARLKRIPNDRAAIQAIADNAFHTGNYARAEEYYAKAMSLPNLTSHEYNAHSWSTLFTAASDRAKAIEEARHGVELSPHSYPVLNTLAVLYADDDKTSEARETLLQSLEASSADEPQASDWYVLGRIAETYGIKDAAVEAYERIPKPEQVHGSSWELAQKRLTGLRTKPM